MIKEDLPKDVREDRRVIGNTPIKMLEAGKKARIRGNKIFFNGKFYAEEDLHLFDQETSGNEPQLFVRREQFWDRKARGTPAAFEKIISFFAGTRRKLSC